MLIFLGIKGDNRDRTVVGSLMFPFFQTKEVKELLIVFVFLNQKKKKLLILQEITIYTVIFIISLFYFRRKVDKCTRRDNFRWKLIKFLWKNNNILDGKFYNISRIFITIFFQYKIYIVKLPKYICKGSI